jgi:hypothetical protein
MTRPCTHCSPKRPRGHRANPKITGDGRTGAPARRHAGRVKDRRSPGVDPMALTLGWLASTPTNLKLTPLRQGQHGTKGRTKKPLPHSAFSWNLSVVRENNHADSHSGDEVGDIPVTWSGQEDEHCGARCQYECCRTRFSTVP